MNPPSASQQQHDTTPNLTSPHDALRLNTSSSHRYLLLTGTTFVVFEILFLILYANDFWFSLNLAPWGVIAICAAGAVAHYLLAFTETPAGCRLVQPLKHGLPLFFYRYWTTIYEDHFGIGSRQILWPAVSELRLTIFSNLQILSDRLCGADTHDVVLSFPFNCAGVADQHRFIEAARKGNALLVINSRLQQRLAKTETRGSRSVQAFTVLVLGLVLLDLGYGSFKLLENLKDYYLAQVEVLHGHPDQAARYLAYGDQILNDRGVISWVNSKFFHKGIIASTVHRARSEAFWQLGRKQEALDEARIALKLNPRSFRLNLHLARILDSLGQPQQARNQLVEAISNRNDLLLPRLYLMAWLQKYGKSQAARQYYHVTLNDLDDEVFGDEPCWPPGGNHFLPETIYQEDLRFVLDRLL